MRSLLPILLLVATSATGACRSSGAGPLDPFGDLGSFNGATVEVSAIGGIGALSTSAVVRHDDRAFIYSQRQLCAATCPAPLDSASGTLSAAATDSLFNIVLEQLRSSLKDDYGSTPNSADMVTYTVRVTAPGGVRSIRADDGTMPAPMRQIVQAVRGIIFAARR